MIKKGVLIKANNYAMDIVFLRNKNYVILFQVK